MTILTALTSFLVGSVAGIIYGLSFLFLRGGKVLSLIYTIIRFSAAGIFFFYLLRFPEIHFIILLPSFLVIFWLTVFYRKATVHERF